MSNAISSQEFKLEVETTTSPSSFVEVKEITDFQLFDGQAAEIDVTHLRSTAKEFRIGLQEWGSMNISTNYLSADTGQTAMRQAKASRDRREFRITFSNNQVVTFQGYVKSAPINGGVDSKVDGAFNVKIDGDVTFA